MREWIGGICFSEAEISEERSVRASSCAEAEREKTGVEEEAEDGEKAGPKWLRNSALYS